MTTTNLVLAKRIAAFQAFHEAMGIATVGYSGAVEGATERLSHHHDPVLYIRDIDAAKVSLNTAIDAIHEVLFANLKAADEPIDLPTW